LFPDDRAAVFRACAAGISSNGPIREPAQNSGAIGERIRLLQFLKRLNILFTPFILSDSSSCRVFRLGRPWRGRWNAECNGGADFGNYVSRRAESCSPWIRRPIE
jgi:hypothetical protein